MTCGAKTRIGVPCQKYPISGKTRCRLHGGLSLSGEAHPNYKHGNCSKENRQKTAERNAYIKYLEQLAIHLGMIRPKRR